VGAREEHKVHWGRAGDARGGFANGEDFPHGGIKGVCAGGGEAVHWEGGRETRDSDEAQGGVEEIRGEGQIHGGGGGKEDDLGSKFKNNKIAIKSK